MPNTLGMCRFPPDGHARSTLTATGHLPSEGGRAPWLARLSGLDPEGLRSTYVLESLLPASGPPADHIPTPGPLILFLPTKSYSHHPDSGPPIALTDFCVQKALQELWKRGPEKKPTEGGGDCTETGQ